MVETVEIGYLGLSLKSKWQGYHQGQDSGYLRTLVGANFRISQKAASWALLDSGAPKNSLGIAPVRLQLPGHQPHTKLERGIDSVLGSKEPNLEIHSLRTVNNWFLAERWSLKATFRCRADWNWGFCRFFYYLFICLLKYQQKSAKWGRCVDRLTTRQAESVPFGMLLGARITHPSFWRLSDVK